MPALDFNASQRMINFRQKFIPGASASATYTPS